GAPTIDGCESSSTRREATSGGAVPHSRNSIHGQVSRGAEFNPSSTGRVTTAFAATALVVMGTLVVTGALLVLAALIPLGIHAARSVYARVLARQIAAEPGTTLAAIRICKGTGRFIARAQH